MGYPRDLDEVSSESLQLEIHRRLENGKKGLCDYCGRISGSMPLCRFPDRHNAPLRTVDLASQRLREISEWIDNYGPNRARDPEAQMWGRVAKVAEERTEVITALIGYTDQNPRKGKTHTLEDVLAELYDEALTALAAAVHLGEHMPMDALRRHIDKVHERVIEPQGMSPEEEAEARFFLGRHASDAEEWDDAIVLADLPEFAIEEARRDAEG